MTTFTAASTACDRLLGHLATCFACRANKALRLTPKCATRAQLVRETLYERHGKENN